MERLGHRSHDARARVAAAKSAVAESDVSAHRLHAQSRLTLPGSAEKALARTMTIRPLRLLAEAVAEISAERDGLVVEPGPGLDTQRDVPADGLGEDGRLFLQRASKRKIA